MIKAATNTTASANDDLVPDVSAAATTTMPGCYCSTFDCCLCSPLRYVCVALWPLASIVLGIVSGCVLSVIITGTVFLLTLVRTPMHVGKMLYVAATVAEPCFVGRWFSGGLFLRVPVLLCVPVVHVSFLAGITLFSATAGTLYYIGRCTKIFYNHEYLDSAKKLKSNAKLEPKSYLGKYYKHCQDFMKNDRESYPTIRALKAILALVPGLLLSLLVLVPFSLAVVAITIYRLPINVFKTIKIALFTVVLRWDLRFVVLLALPLIHALFPLVAFAIAVVGSFGWTWWRTTKNLYEGECPFHRWSKLGDALREYHAAHEDFVSKHCHRYDHATGIPFGWDGTSYGLPVKDILEFQWNFLLSCFFIVLEAPICLVGTTLIGAIKFIPCCAHCWVEYTTVHCCGANRSCISVLTVWPFHVLAIILFPAAIAVVCFIILVPLSAVLVCFLVPRALFGGRCCCYEPDDGTGCRAALNALWYVLRTHDSWTSEMFCGGEDSWRILPPGQDDFDDDGGCGSCWTLLCCGKTGENEESPSRNAASRTHGDATDQSSYWDRFVSQCIRTCDALLEEGFITARAVEGLEPAVIQSVPAVAILTILVDSVRDKNLQRGDIKWQIDGTVCSECKNRPVADGITTHLWPLVIEIKGMLLRKARRDNKLATTENIRALTAMLCDNANNEEGSDAIKGILDATNNKDDDAMRSRNNKIRTKINNLVFAILRVKPYQERMERIFSYPYAKTMLDDDLEQQIQVRSSGKGCVADDGEGVVKQYVTTEIVGDDDSKTLPPNYDNPYDSDSDCFPYSVNPCDWDGDWDGDSDSLPSCDSYILPDYESLPSCDSYILPDCDNPCDSDDDNDSVHSTRHIARGNDSSAAEVKPAIFDLVKNLFNNDGCVVLHALGDLVEMCYSAETGVKSGEEITRYGGQLAVFKAMEKFKDDPAIQAGCFAVLGNLAHESTSTTKVLVRMGVASSAVFAMRRFNDSESVHKYGCFLLRKLSNHLMGGDAEVVVDAGGLDTVMEAVNTYPENVELQLDAYGTLRNMAKIGRDMKEEIIQAQAGPILLDSADNNEDVPVTNTANDANEESRTAASMDCPGGNDNNHDCPDDDDPDEINC